MTSTRISRRESFASFSSLAIAASLWRLASAAELSDQRLEHITAVARRIYPHNDLADDVYTECLETILKAAEVDQVLEELLRHGLDRLNTAAGGDWLNATADIQISVLEQHEDSNFFLTLQNHIRTRLYEHPAVWKLIGYEGSSVEYGGYLERGFNDIDWLPED